MKHFNFLKSTNFRFSFRKLIISFFILCFGYSNAQNYRNAKAYIMDFGKNELFVKESLMEYSISIIDASPQERIESTLERIYVKLEDINETLLRNDRGVFGDLDLRNSFMRLNSKTITLLKNKSLKLNDYSVQSNLDYSEIFKNFAYKESEIAKYYAEILTYESTKKDFGLKYNILIRVFDRTNVFEYDAYQNLIFYKLNILDVKLMDLLKGKDVAKVTECMNFITSVGEESFTKTEQMKDDFKDTSLNDINKELIAFILKQKEDVIAYYEEYVKVDAAFQKVKLEFVEKNDVVSIEQYNVEVRKFNEAKNNFYDNLYKVQLNKKSLLEKWYFTNSDFLKRNVEFDNLYEKYSNVD